MAIGPIEVRKVAEQHTAVVRHRMSLRETARIPEWIGQTFEAVQRTGQQPTGMPFCRYFSMEGDSMDIEIGWPVAQPFGGDGEVHASTLPGGRAVVASHFGPYDEIGPVYEEIQAWCGQHGHEIVGPPWESDHTDPQEEPDPAKWRTDVHFPVRA